VTLGSHVMWTMGDDFRYMDAHMWYKNLDKLIKAVNADGRVEAFYSTPYEYTLAKLTEPNVTYPPLKGDFFPYRDTTNAFWTGYYTSRPALKRYVRSTSSYWSISRQIQVAGGVFDSTVSRSYLAEALGLLQHHDAVAGTAKQHVAFDYAKRLYNGTQYDLGLLAKGLTVVTGTTGFNLVACLRTNQSECEPLSAAANNSFSLIVWNGLPYARDITIEVPVAVPTNWLISGVGASYSTYASRSGVTNYALENDASLPYTFGIIVRGVPPLGMVPLLFDYQGRLEQPVKKPIDEPAQVPLTGRHTFNNDFIRFTVSMNASEWLEAVTELETGTTVAVTQDWCYYWSNTGDSVSGQASGAYIFRPVTNSSCFHPCPAEANASTVRVILNDTNLVVVERQVCTWITERLLLSTSDRTLRHQFSVGPIDDFLNTQGREVVSRFKTTLVTNKTFYTDSNGRELQERILNYRATWPFTQSEPVAGNYYPVNALALLKGINGDAFAIAVDSSVGGASLEDGQIELMVHRRLMVDDGRGVGEPLNETEFTVPYWNCGNDCGAHTGAPLIVRGEHRIIVGNVSSIARQYRRSMEEQYFQPPPFLLVQTSNNSLPLIAPYAMLPADLPMNIQVVTLQQVAVGTILLRIGHKFALGEDAVLSSPAQVSVCQFFASGASVQETTLTTNQNIGAAFATGASQCMITIGPMDIRTFLVSQ
jgi:hypothetical protein